MTIVEIKEKDASCFNKRLALFIWYGDDKQISGVVIPVKPVPCIPKSPLPSRFYIKSDIKERNLRYADAIHDRIAYIRANKDVRTLPPIQYVPPTGFFEINAHWEDHNIVPTSCFGEVIKEIDPVTRENILNFLQEQNAKQRFTPLERIEMYLTDDEREASNLKRWSKRKKAVLTKLWGKFEVDEIAQYFKLEPDELLKLAKKFDLK